MSFDFGFAATFSQININKNTTPLVGLLVDEIKNLKRKKEREGDRQRGRESGRNALRLKFINFSAHFRTHSARLISEAGQGGGSCGQAGGGSAMLTSFVCNIKVAARIAIINK